MSLKLLVTVVCSDAAQKLWLFTKHCLTFKAPDRHCFQWPWPYPFFCSPLPTHPPAPPSQCTSGQPLCTQCEPTASSAPAVHTHMPSPAPVTHTVSASHAPISSYKKYGYHCRDEYFIFILHCFFYGGCAGYRQPCLAQATHTRRSRSSGIGCRASLT